MTMLDIHTEALESVSTVFHEFLLRFKAHAKTVYGIVEGKEDPMFYRGLIERCLPEDWKVDLFPAGQKKNVYRAFASFDWERYPAARICFFVDRDLSEFLESQEVTAANIYVTDNYSIENDIVAFDVLVRVIQEVMNIPDLTVGEREELEKRFQRDLDFFRCAMAPLMAQTILWRRAGSAPCLNNIRPKTFFQFVDGQVVLKTPYQSTESLVQEAARCVGLPPSTRCELENMEVAFRERQGLQKFIRGKYLLWFLVEFALDVHRTISKYLPRFTSSPKVRISLGSSNAMVILAPRVRCPRSLNAFLDRTYGHFIRDVINDSQTAEGATASAPT